MMGLDKQEANDCVVDYLLRLSGPQSDHVPIVPSRNYWPLASWEACDARCGYGISWSHKIGPSQMRPKDCANWPTGYLQAVAHR